MKYEIITIESFGISTQHVIIDNGDGSFKSIPCVDDNPEWLAFKEQEGI